MDVYYRDLCQSDNELDRSHGNAYCAPDQVGDTSPTGVACEITGDTWPHVESWIRSSIGRSVARYRARTGIDVELQGADIDDIAQDASVLLLEAIGDLDELDLDGWKALAYRLSARSTWKHLRDNSAELNTRLSADEWNSLSDEDIRFSPRTTDLSGLQSAIECLPSETSRQVAIYLACSDFTQEEIGTEIGVTREAIRNQIAKLRRRLGSSLVWRAIRSGATCATYGTISRSAPVTPRVDASPIVEWIDGIVRYRMVQQYPCCADLSVTRWITTSDRSGASVPYADYGVEYHTYAASLPTARTSNWIVTSGRSGAAIPYTDYPYAGFRILN